MTVAGMSVGAGGGRDERKEITEIVPEWVKK